MEGPAGWEQAVGPGGSLEVKAKQAPRLPPSPLLCGEGPTLADLPGREGACDLLCYPHAGVFGVYGFL